MAKDHRQIYDWTSEEKKNFGVSYSVPVDEASEEVVKAAIKAASLVGDGLCVGI